MPANQWIINSIMSVIEQNRSVHILYNLRPNEYHKQAARLVTKYTSSGRVIDLGCGTGIIPQLIHENNSTLELFGADVDDKCLEIAKERTPSLQTLKMEADPFDISNVEKEYYDACVMSHVLEHTLNPLDVIGKVMSILKPGGHFIVSTPNPVRPEVMVLAMLRVHYVNRGHVHAWDRSHWKNFLENIAKLDVVEYAIDDIRLIPYAIKSRLPVLRTLERGAARLFPWWSFSNISVIRKPLA